MRQLTWPSAVGLVVALCVSGYANITGPPEVAAQGTEPSQEFSPQAVLDAYCVTCHNTRTLTAGLALDELDPSNLREAEETWEKVVRRVKVGMMPPQGMPQPAPDVRASFVAALERSLDNLAAADPFPGRSSFRRLNRAEYANVIRDLLALEIDPATYLPPDELVYGFDNIGDALALSTSLLESYSAAAAQIATLAVGDVADVVPGSTVYRTKSDLSQSGRNEGLPLGTEGGLLVRQAVPVDGEFELSATLFKTNLGLMRGLEFPREMHFLVDGELVHSLTVGGKESYEAMLQNQTEHAIELEAQMRIRVPFEGRRPRHRRHVRATGAGVEHTARAGFRTQHQRHFADVVRPAPRADRDGHGAVVHPGRERHAGPCPNLRVQPGHTGRRGALRATDPLDTRAPGVPGPGHTGRRGRTAALVPCGTR